LFKGRKKTTPPGEKGTGTILTGKRGFPVSQGVPIVGLRGGKTKNKPRGGNVKENFKY